MTNPADETRIKQLKGLLSKHGVSPVLDKLDLINLYSFFQSEITKSNLRLLDELVKFLDKADYFSGYTLYRDIESFIQAKRKELGRGDNG